MSYPVRNSDIALQLINQFSGLIDGISLKMGVRYHLSVEDREDLVAAAKAKLGTIRWRTVLRRGGGKNVNNYAISVIQTSMVKELRKIRAEGLSGLSKGPAITAFPQHFDVDDQPERGADGLADRIAVADLIAKAQELLTFAELAVIILMYGLNGGDELTEQQIAKELDISRSRVEVLLESAMTKLRRSLNAR